MEKVKVKLSDFVKKHYKEIIGISLVLILGAFLRLYNISGYMHFLGDEGRDLIIVRNLLVYKDIILIGPGTSVGNMYLGPLYYYLIAPALLLSNFHPVGPSIFVALLGVATIFITYKLAKKWFGITAAFVAATMYAVLPLFIRYSNFSWNPNVTPFFSVLSIYLLDRIKSNKDNYMIILSLASFAFVMQSHYMGVFLLPVLLYIWITKLRDKQNKKPLVLSSILGIGVFFLLMSPLLIFDIRHNYQNFNALKEYLGGLEGSRTYSLFTFVERTIVNIRLMIKEIISAPSDLVAAIYSFFVIIGTAFVYLYNKNKYAVRVVALSVLMSTLGLTLYGGRIISHYYGFVFTIFPVIFGAILSQALNKRKVIGVILAVAVLSPIVYFAIDDSVFAKRPMNLVKRSEAVADKIIKEAYGSEFNLAVLSDSNYEDGYRYFLELKGFPSKKIDPQRYDVTVAGQLFVVCEKPETECDPVHSPKTEIANFGWSRVSDRWNIEGLTLFKLVHAR